MSSLRNLRVLSILALTALTLGAGLPGRVDADEQSRFSRTAEGRASAATVLRERLADAGVVEAQPLVSSGPRVAPGRAAAAKRIGAAAGTGMQAANEDGVYFSIYDAASELFYDLDRDGYFHGFAVTFDADVSAGWADVYAVLFLSRNGGPWNHYYTTQVFSIAGANADDAYEVVTELDVGYPTGDYDVLIELYDAYSDAFLTDFGPDDDGALAWLPLEDAELDLPYYPEPHYGGGGGTGPLLITGLMLLAAWGRQRRLLSAQLAGDRGRRQKHARA